MPDLCIHPHTQSLIDNFLREPSHALLLVGEQGVGLMTIANDIAGQMTASAFVTRVTPENGTISIDAIRALYAHTKTKQADRHVIIIDDADAMRAEAQNALLKLLEEPASEVYFILTSHHEQLLLPTIKSRVQMIAARPVPAEASQQLLGALKVNDETKTRQILFIAAGRPAEMVRLTNDEQYFVSQSTKATDARNFLGAETYDRLVLTGKYNAREEALEFLDMLGRLAVHMLYRQPGSEYSKRLEAIADAVERINGNGHVRTQLARLVMQWA